MGQKARFSDSLTCSINFKPLFPTGEKHTWEYVTILILSFYFKTGLAPFHLNENCLRTFPPLCNKGLNNLILVKKSGCFHRSKIQKLNKDEEAEQVCPDGVRSPRRVLPIRVTHGGTVDCPSWPRQRGAGFLWASAVVRSEGGPCTAFVHTLSRPLPFQWRKGIGGFSL